MASKKLGKSTPDTGNQILNKKLSKLWALRDLFEENPLKLSLGFEKFDQQKVVTWTVDPKKFPTLDVMHITDVQFGNICCNEARMIEYRDWILAEPNRFMVWGGDMIDAGTKLSVGSPFEQICEPQGQVYRFCELWAPARHRVLGYVGPDVRRFRYVDRQCPRHSILWRPAAGGYQLRRAQAFQNTPLARQGR